MGREEAECVITSASAGRSPSLRLRMFDEDASFGEGVEIILVREITYMTQLRESTNQAAYFIFLSQNPRTPSADSP